MTEYLSAYVVDANVLIDLHAGGLLDVIPQLPFKFLAPDVVIAELVEPEGKTLLRLGLESHSLDGEHVAEVYRLAAAHADVSVNDLFALVLAQTFGTTLLTGDKHLRVVAHKEGAAVRGTLWLLDEIVALKLVPAQTARQALELMLKEGRRLPKAECQQ